MQEQSPTTLKSLALSGARFLKKGRGLPDFKIDPSNSTKHDLVDKIGCIKLQGFIHDNKWLRHPRLQSPDSKRGKTNLAHSILWAFLIDRYRPYKKMRVEGDEKIVWYEKKFEGQWFTTTYS
ncbi:MAG: hypothetical protein EOP06_30215, partial [Proteobacteria bacterium]